MRFETTTLVDGTHLILGSCLLLEIKLDVKLKLLKDNISKFIPARVTCGTSELVPAHMSHVTNFHDD